MITIADLLDKFSKPVQEVVSVRKRDPDTAFSELSEYIVTERLRAEYESLFRAVTSSLKASADSIALWISGFFGLGKTSLAKNLGYVLSNRELRGIQASSLFVKRVGSACVSEYVEFLNRTVPCEVLALDAYRDLPEDANSEHIAQAMYRAALRDLNGSEYSKVCGLETAFNRLFDVCEMCRPGKTFAFILDDVDRQLAGDSARRKELRVLVEQFGKVSLERVRAGKIPGPAWIVFTGEETLHESLHNCFTHRTELRRADIFEIAARRVLHKKDGQKIVLRKLFQEHGASLIQNLTLEQCSRQVRFDEEEFVEYYPFLRYMMHVSIDAVAGIRAHLDAPKHLLGGSRTIVKQCFDLLLSDRIQLANQPVGALASIDNIFDLLEGSLPPEAQRNVAAIGVRCEQQQHPGMAARVAKALCLMEFVAANLPRTIKNISALLIQHVCEPPPTAAVAAILERMEVENLARQTPAGWKLYEYDPNELLRRTAMLHGLKIAVGTVNPRGPGWRNGLIQIAKQRVARGLSWYTRRLDDFNGSVMRSLEEIVGVLDRLMDIPIDMIVLQKRLAQSEETIASLQQQLNVLHSQISAPPSRIGPRLAGERTAYILGLYGTGRLYLCDVMQQNIGARAKYFRDRIRLHLGPTPMIYSGHATIKYVSCGQYLPAVTSRVLEGVRAAFADLIFIYRHPLDSLLTNWIWWRTYLRDATCVSGITQAFRNRNDLYTELEQNFFEFKAFAEGDPAFFGRAEAGSRFLSFAEFVEETELFLQCGATLSLRLEDFMIDPRKEFLKIAEVMSSDIDLSRLHVEPPKSKAYGYMAVRDKVSRFRNFIDELNVETKKRIERIGYEWAT